MHNFCNRRKSLEELKYDDNFIDKISKAQFMKKND